MSFSREYFGLILTSTWAGDNMAKLKLSIVIVSFHAEKLLKKCLGEVCQDHGENRACDRISIELLNRGLHRERTLKSL